MLIGFALIVKRKVLEKVGYLDERFNPGNFEDDDLSLRILMNNYQNVLVYNSFLIHLGSVSFNNADYFNLLHKNFDKWGCGQILGPTMTGRKKNVVYGGREKESTSIV